MMIKTITKSVGILSVSFLLFASVASLKAAQDNAEINLNVDIESYVNFTGSLVNASIFYNVDEIEPATAGVAGTRLVMGTLGLASNSGGNCVVGFSTQNDFRLFHTTTNQKLTNYRILWKGENVKRLPNRELTLPCESAATNFQFQSVGPFLDNPTSGIYQDIMTLTVTTE